METDRPKPPGLFEGAARYYARYRPFYPGAAFDLLIQRFALLAAGPGSGLGVWAEDGRTAWGATAKAVVQEFLGPERRAGGGVYRESAERHETVLARSAFARVERLELVADWTLTIEAVVGLQLSTSYASPALLGNRVEQFRERLTERLQALAPDGRFSSEMSYEVLIATRPV
jgi:hypothetical protein